MHFNTVLKNMQQMRLFFVLFCALVPRATIADIKLEAEDAVLTGVTIQTQIGSFSGSGYVTDFDNDNDKITFSVNIQDINAASQLYELKIQYNSPFGDKGFGLIVNGHATSGTFTGNGNQFSLISAGKFPMDQGSNTVVIGNGWGYFSIDFIVLVPSEPVQFNIRTLPINPSATVETKRLYTDLLRQFGKKVLSGQQFDTTEVEYIQQQSGGKEPLVVGYDFINANYFGDLSEQTAYMQKAIDWAKNKGGIVTFCWHWRNPFGISNDWSTLGFYVDKDNVHVDLNQLSNTNSREYQALVRDIDHVAIYLKQAQSAKVPILFRPLHEAQGRWFWWGEQGPTQTKQLYRLLYDRLVHYHQINNLLWVWTTEAGPSALDWYPGDDIVDILGMDIYEAKGQHNSHILQFLNVKQLFKGTKMIALSENGGIPDPNKLLKDGAHWSWFMTWWGEMIWDESWNTKAFINSVYNHPHILTRGQF